MRSTLSGYNTRMEKPELYKPRPEKWPQFTVGGLFALLTICVLLLPCIVVAYQDWQNSSVTVSLDDRPLPFPSVGPELDIQFR